MDLKLLESVMRAFCPQTNKGHFNVPEGYNFKAAVFDLDGVVTQTSHLHEESWKKLFDEFLHKRKNEAQARGGAKQQKEDGEDGEKKQKKTTKEERKVKICEEGDGGGKEKGEEVVEVTEGDQFRPFDESDYLQYVDGRPRMDGTCVCVCVCACVRVLSVR
jgi:hypothetical protein